MELWFRGERLQSTALFDQYEHIIVAGPPGSGKTILCKAMSTLVKTVIYCEVQHIDEVDDDFRKAAIECINLDYCKKIKAKNKRRGKEILFGIKGVML